MDKAKRDEVVGAARLITVDTVAGRLLIVEPVDPTKKHFETTMVLMAAEGASGESKCYDCWYAYYHCIFSGGKNCDGSNCAQICKDEKGGSRVFAPSTYERISRALEQ
jgi:hypothetical protein